MTYDKAYILPSFEGTLIPYTKKQIQSEITDAMALVSKHYGVSRKDILDTRKRSGMVSSARWLMVSIVMKELKEIEIGFLMEYLGFARSCVRTYRKYETTITRNPKLLEEVCRK